MTPSTLIERLRTLREYAVNPIWKDNAEEAANTIERLEADASQIERWYHAVKDERVRLVGELNLANSRITSQSTKLATLEAELKTATLRLEGVDVQKANLLSRAKKAEKERERDAAVLEAAKDVAAAHKDVIEAVTPGAERSLGKGPIKGEKQEEYEARFSRWHSTTRALIAALQHAQEQVGEDR